jgi:RNA polymerase sigma factor (sigma-70 family)
LIARFIDNESAGDELDTLTRNNLGRRLKPESYGCEFEARGLIYKEEGGFSCVAVIVADPKPSLVERLFTEQGAALQSFFRRRLRSKSDAADLAQEVYVRMLRISDQEAIRNPVHYLYTVANNLVKEHAVLERRQASGVDIDETSAQEQEQLKMLPAFDGELDARQRIARLGVVLKQLRPKCRAAVVLRFTHELSYREIAIHLGVSPQMAKKYVAQGLSHCQRRMTRLG